MQGIENFNNHNNTQIKMLQDKTAFKAYAKNSTPQTDTFEGKDKKLSKTSKLLSLAGLAAAAFGTVYGIKKYNVTNIKNIQKAFNETFMRDDITPEMARAIKARYKKIEKIKDPQEYAKALFEEAKKNYGFENSPIKLIFEPSKSSPNVHGFCRRNNSAISITPEGLKHRKHILNTMHHEFRHAKQHEYLGTPDAMNTFADNFIDKLDDKKIAAMGGPDKLASKIKDMFFQTRENQVPKHLKEWYDKCRQGASNYTLENFSEYWNNFTEQDARKAGRTIEKYVRSKAFMFKNWFSEFLLTKNKSM